jgi:hypothetical protein
MADAGVMASSSDPVLVTTAGKSPGQERRERERRYLLTMGLRVLCFIAAIVLFAVGPRWAGLVAAIGSLVLPWVGVFFAPARTPATPSLYAAEAPKELPPQR